MIARRTRLSLAALSGAIGLLALSACSTNEPYGARYDEYGYSYTQRQHGLYNDAQYRYQSSRDRYDYDDYRYAVYDEDGDLIYYRNRHRD